MSRPRQTPTQILGLVWGFAASVLLAPATSNGAQPGRLQALTASAGSVPVGTPVSLTLETTGRRCGFEIDYGDGTPVQMGKVNKTKTFGPRKFSQGSHTVTVRGAKLGKTAKCKGSVLQVVLTVQKKAPEGIDAPPGSRFGTGSQDESFTRRGHQPEFGSSKGAPDSKVQPPRTLKRPGGFATGIAPDVSFKEGRGRLPKKPLSSDSDAGAGRPVITKAFHMPPSGGGIPGEGQTLVPGGEIELGGQYLGNQPGQVFLTGVPGFDPLPLEILKWSHLSTDSALVRIPEIDAPFQRLDVRLFVRRKIGLPQVTTSIGLPRTFERPGELVLLSYKDAAIDVSCSNNANENYCNTKSYAGGGETLLCTAPSHATRHDEELTIRGGHGNCHAAVGDDLGDDEYRIRLANGWVIHQITAQKGTSSGDDWVSAPSAASLHSAIGTSSLTVKAKWKATPADMVWYTYKIWIKGPKGTRWF